MDLYAPIVRLALARLDAVRRRSGHYPMLRQLRDSQYWSPERLRELQFAKLNNLLRHAWRTCPWYRMRLDEIGYTPGEVFDEISFREVPLLRKTDIQSNRETLRSNGIRAGDLIPNQTGGSTGEPLKFFVDRGRMASRLAATLRHNEWAGFRPGDRVAILWGAAQDAPHLNTLSGRLRNALLERAMWLNAVRLDEATLHGFLDEFNRRQPSIILAYAHTLFLFAQYADSVGITPHSPRAIITSAEFLSDHERAVIERVFRSRVYDRYGCREVSILASECEAHNGMHINAENLYVEIIRDSRPCRDGETGEVIVTDLDNLAMPFIRYAIQDSAEPISGACACGRTLPRLRMAGGRVTEFLVTARGDLVAGAALTIFLSTAVAGVRQMQIRQHTLGAVTFRIVADKTTLQEAALKSRAAEFLGSDTQVAIEYVENIPRTSSGKYQFSVSSVAPAFLSRGLNQTANPEQVAR